jgi:hypothetical protein
MSSQGEAEMSRRIVRRIKEIVNFICEDKMR